MFTNIAVRSRFYSAQGQPAKPKHACKTLVSELKYYFKFIKIELQEQVRNGVLFFCQ